MAEVERGRSVEPEGRRVNAVSPMHLNESAMLKNLWQEARVQQQQKEHQAIMDENDKEMKLQMMLEKYQNQVRIQQQTQNDQSSKLSETSKSTHGSTSSNHILPSTSHENRSRISCCSTNPSMSHSQPCLIAVSDKPDSLQGHLLTHAGRCSSTEHDSSLPGYSSSSGKPISNNPKLIQSLREENLHLKYQVDIMKKKTARLQQLETAHEEIAKEYTNLMLEREKQDTLEKSVLVAMDMQIKRLLKEKENLQERLDQMTLCSNPQTVEQMTKLNILVSELIPENNELKAMHKRQQVELQAQRATLEEMRTHIAMLETALSNAQDRLAKKEKMGEEQSAAAERIAYLQKLLHDAICDKQARDENHAEERARLEMEITQLKMHLNKDFGIGGIKKGSTRSGAENSEENVAKLKKVIHSKDERITQLEKSLMDLQRKLHEEMEKRNSALDLLSDNLEKKIKRLEEEKFDKDRRIAELTEKTERMGELLEEQRDADETSFQSIKRRQRAEGNALNVCGDHSRSSSGSHHTTHLRTSGGPFDLFDSASLLSEISNGRLSAQQVLPPHYSSRASTLSYGLFRPQEPSTTPPGIPHTPSTRDEPGDHVWNV